jgi:hypothetical protein
MRIACCVPHCKRTRKHVAVPVVVDGHVVDFGAEWICQKHWSAVPSALRREHVAAKRNVKRLGTFAADLASYQVWRRCKAIATEIAFGIS